MEVPVLIQNSFCWLRQLTDDIWQVILWHFIQYCKPFCWAKCCAGRVQFFVCNYPFKNLCQHRDNDQRLCLFIICWTSYWGGCGVTLFPLFKSAVGVENFGGRCSRQLQRLGWAESGVLISSQQDSPELVYLLLKLTCGVYVCRHICASCE